MNSFPPEKQKKRSSSSSKIRVEFKGTPVLVRKKIPKLYKPQLERSQPGHESPFHRGINHRKTPSLDYQRPMHFESNHSRARNMSFQLNNREEEKSTRVLSKVRGDIDSLEDDEFVADQGTAFNPLLLKEKPSPAKNFTSMDSLIAGPVTQAHSKKHPSSFLKGSKGRNTDLKKIRSLSRGAEKKSFFSSHSEKVESNKLNLTLEQASINSTILVGANSTKAEKSFLSKQGRLENKGSFASSSSQSSLFTHGARSFAPSWGSTLSKLSGKTSKDFGMLQKAMTLQKIQKCSFNSADRKQNVILRFSYSTKPGHKVDKKPKENQDSIIINPKMLGNRSMHLFGVCDGHGIQGKKASEYVQINLTKNIACAFKEILKQASLEEIPDQYIAHILHNSVLKTNQEVVNAPFDTLFSGTTCCCAFFVGRKCFTINVGDSRAIIIKQLSGQYIAKPVTKDHKPDDFQEQKRIVASGGKVHPYIDLATNEFCGPQRVYNMKGEVPGLAMSRSIGDEIAKRYGVTAEPQINVYELHPEDKYLVIASDGVWEFLDNQRVANISSTYMRMSEPERAVKSVMREALHAWKKNEENVIDDITCIILQLDCGHSEEQNHGSETSTHLAQPFWQVITLKPRTDCQFQPEEE